MSLNLPKISVITCTWNSVATLAETLDSIACQTYRNFEQVFVDGGSTDGTLEMIAERCPGATVLRDVRGGISRAMNQGVLHSTGDVFCHLHSDDYFATADTLQKVANRFSAVTECMWLYGSILIDRGGQAEAWDARFRPFSHKAYAMGSISVAHPAVFMRRALFEEFGGFDETLKYAMDIDLWLRLGQRYRPEVIDEALTVFRDHPGSVSSANKLKARQEEWAVRRRYFRSAPLQTAVFGLRYLRRNRRLRAEGVTG